MCLPIIVGSWYYKKLTSSFQLLFWFYILSLFVEIVAGYFKSVYNNNLPILHFFTIVEMTTFSYIYYFSLSRNLKKVVFANYFVFVAIAVLNAFYVHGIWKHNSLSRPYESISLVVYSVLYFHHLLRSDYEFYIWRYPVFWFSLSVFIYFSLNSLNFMLDNYFISNTQNVMTVSVYTHALFNIIANCLSAQSFKCFRTLKTKW